MHLSKIFKPNLREIILEEENKLLSDDIISATLDPYKALHYQRNESLIKNLNPKKASSYDLITNQVLQKLPEMGIKFITQLCNVVLRWGFFPNRK